MEHHDIAFMTDAGRFVFHQVNIGGRVSERVADELIESGDHWKRVADSILRFSKRLGGKDEAKTSGVEKNYFMGDFRQSSEFMICTDRRPGLFFQMAENQTTDCFFIGGTADGKWLPVADLRSEFRVTSQADQTNDPHALEDGDPRPEKERVVETYFPVTVSHGGTQSTVFALKIISDGRIMVQVARHYGADATITR